MYSMHPTNLLGGRAGNVRDPIAALIGDYNSRRDEAIRATKLRFAVVLAVLALVVFVSIILLATDERFYELITYSGRRRGFPLFISTPLLILLLGCLWSRGVTDKLRQKARKELFPHVFAHIDGFAFTNGLPAPSLEKMPRKTVGYHLFSQFDDCITGEYRDLPVEISEVRMKRPRMMSRGFKTVFAGVSLSFPFDAATGADIVVRPHSMVRSIRSKLLLGSRFASMESGLRDIDSGFDLYSTDPARSGPYVSEKIVLVLRWMAEAWPHGRCSLSIAEGRAFLLLPYERDLFELPEIHTPVDYARHIVPIIADVDVLMRTAYAVRDMLDQTTGQPLAA